VTDDLDRIMAIMASAFDPDFGEAWTRGQVEGALSMGNCDYLLVAADGASPGEEETAAGFALLRTALDESELLLFAVLPEYRRRGLGTRLLETIFRFLQTKHVQRITLEMRDGNPAEQLYRNHGFQQIGRRPKYYLTQSGNRIDALTFAQTVD
jgi:ribosomal-protein-alanine N-acetyltransferase